METVRAQAKEMFPTIYLTLMSIIQALALEALWSAVNERSHLWSWNVDVLTGWLQVCAVAELIFFLWMASVHVIIRFRWVVSLRDSLNPFVIGIGEFWLTALIQPHTVHLWFYLLAAGFAFGVWVNWSTVRAAEREPENMPYFRLFAPRARHYNRPLAGVILVSLFAGVVIQWFARSGWVAVGFTALMNVIMIGLIFYNALGWERAVKSQPTEEIKPVEPLPRRVAGGRRR